MGGSRGRSDCRHFSLALLRAPRSNMLLRWKISGTMCLNACLHDVSFLVTFCLLRTRMASAIETTVIPPTETTDHHLHECYQHFMGCLHFLNARRMQVIYIPKLKFKCKTPARYSFRGPNAARLRFPPACRAFRCQHLWLFAAAPLAHAESTYTFCLRKKGQQTAGRGLCLQAKGIP